MNQIRLQGLNAHVRRLMIVMSLSLLLNNGAARAQSQPAVVREIRDEALRKNNSGGRPLPLAGHWNAGDYPDGFDPDYQMTMIERGHHLLPWFGQPSPDSVPGNPQQSRYFERAFKRAAALKLPISFLSTQWERLLTDDPAFFNLPADENPNVINFIGQPQRMVSPFGPVASWREVGRKWITSPMLSRLEEWYPEPPRVLFVSNNEHPKPEWGQIEMDLHFVKLYGTGRDREFLRQTVSEGWIERYRAMQVAMVDGMKQKAWKANSVLIGYNAFGVPFFGRSANWPGYSLTVPGRVDANPLMWDGGSPSYYVWETDDSTDYTVYSPQIEAMNYVFMQQDAWQANPDFWFEFSVWDGRSPGAPKDKAKIYASRGQTFTPERYGGFVQFGMWLLRPRVVREFRPGNDTKANSEAYFLPIVAAVDRVYANQVLKSFWRSGTLVPNRAHQHPYQSNIPTAYQKVDRWFLLETSLDPPRPWTQSTALPVFSLALVQGKKPARQWLLYAHSPLAARKGVAITLPDYGVIKIDVNVGGSFYLVNEKGNKVKMI